MFHMFRSNVSIVNDDLWMLDAHAHVMQVKLCKANTRGVTAPPPPGVAGGARHRTPPACWRWAPTALPTLPQAPTRTLLGWSGHPPTPLTLHTTPSIGICTPRASSPPPPPIEEAGWEAGVEHADGMCQHLSAQQPGEQLPVDFYKGEGL